MKRKLVKQGTSTMMVSLPSKWIKSNGLDKGSEVDIEEKENQIVISGKPTGTKKELKISVKGFSQTAIRSMITNAYRLSYGKVDIEFGTAQEFNIITETLRKSLIGFEIVSRTDKECTIENITEPGQEHSGNVFLKLLYNIDELIDAVKKMMKGSAEIQYIKEIEENIQRYDNFCRRTAHNAKNPVLLTAYYKEIVQAQREIYMIAIYLEKKKIRLSSQTMNQYESLAKYFGNIKDAYMKNDLSLAEKAHKMEKELIYDKGYTLLRTKKGEESIIIFRILTATRMFYLSLSPFIGLLLDNPVY